MNGKPRQQPGQRELDRTPARNAAHEIVVRVRRVPPEQGGGYRLVPVHADQHAVVARTPPELARAVLSCFTEVELAAYARWKGQRPDLAVLAAADSDSFDEPLNRLGTVASPVLPKRKGHRAAGGWGSGGAREQHPADYTANADGSWTSPKGKRFTSESMIRKIIRRRLAAGLPIEPEACTWDLTIVRDTILKAAARDDVPPHAWLVAAVEHHAQPPRRKAKRVDPEQMTLGINLDDPEPAPGQSKPARHLRVVA